MPADVKLLILGNVAKFERPFRLANITEMTGLERQLVHYHLTKLVEQGKLEKIGKTYSIINKDELIDSMLDGINNSDIRKIKPAGLLGKETTEHLNKLCAAIVYAKALKLPMSIDMAVFMNRMVDETVLELKALKRYVNNSQPGVRTSAKYFQTNTQLYEILVESGFEPEMNKSAWLAALANRLDEDE